MRQPKRAFCLRLLIVLVLTGLTAPLLAQERMAIRFEISHGVPVTDVKIEDKKVRAVLDTAAQRTVVDSSVLTARSGCERVIVETLGGTVLGCLVLARINFDGGLAFYVQVVSLPAAKLRSGAKVALSVQQLIPNGRITIDYAKRVLVIELTALTRNGKRPAPLEPQPRSLVTRCRALSHYRCFGPPPIALCLNILGLTRRSHA